jgi:hypothetical protein
MAGITGEEAGCCHLISLAMGAWCFFRFLFLCFFALLHPIESRLTGSGRGRLQQQCIESIHKLALPFDRDSGDHFQSVMAVR